MKKITFVLFIFSAVLSAKTVRAQNSASAYTGAVATKPHYKALYFLDDADPQKITHTLKNIANALDDERLKGKLEVELVVFGEGFAVYQKTNSYEEALTDLQKKGVILAMCSNTVKARNIDKNTLFPFIGYVPSGNGEIIIRGADGWEIVHP